MRRFFAHMNTQMRWQTAALVWAWFGVVILWDKIFRVAEAHWMGLELLGAASFMLGIVTFNLMRNRMNEWHGKRQHRIDEANSASPPPAPPRT